MVPDGWKILKIEEFAEVKTGGTPSRQNPSYWNGSIPWMASGEIHQRYIKNTAEFITAEGLNNSNARWLPEKTVMIALNGQGKTRGSVGILQTSVTCNQSLAGFIVNHQVCHPEYFFFYLDDKYQFLRDLSGDEGRNGLNLKLLREIEVRLPPLSEQKKIAEILSSVDEAIASTQAVIDQTRKVKQGLLQQLLTRGIGHTKFKESAIGQIPESWEVKAIGELFEVQLGKMLSPKARQGNQLKPYLGNANVQWEHIVLDKILEMDFSEREQEKFRLQPDDLLVCEGGECGRAAIWEGQIKEIYYQKALHRLRPLSSEILSRYMLQYLVLKFQIENAFSGEKTITTIAHLPRIQLMKLPVLLPPKEEQVEIIRLIDGIAASLNTNIGELKSLQNLKQGLMQDLLTGRVRVKAPPNN